MTGFIGFAPIYLNGVLALFFVLVFPGLVFVRAVRISNFPQRWFAVFLISLAANLGLLAFFKYTPWLIDILKTWQFD